MCIACEMGFWDMVDALPPETRERVLREEAARLNAPFVCDEPEATPAPDEHKP
jgi:hypothetical protein